VVHMIPLQEDTKDLAKTILMLLDASLQLSRGHSVHLARI